MRVTACGIVPAILLLAPASRADVTEEVMVPGKKADPGQTTLAHEEVRKVPGAFGDAFRAVEALPGAMPFQSGTPYVILRGAPPGNSATLIDGIQVPLLYHLAIGPAVIHPRLVERVDYYAGGAPAPFGRTVGGVVSAQTREPLAVPYAHAQVRAFDAGALVESPLAGGRANALAAARYSYTAAALSLLSPGVDLDYWDYQARAGVDLGDRDRISAFAFGSHDRRGPIGKFKTTFKADFHRLDLRYDHHVAEGQLRLAATLGEDRSGNEQGTTYGRLARVRLETDRKLGDTAQLRAGADSSITLVDAGVPVAGLAARAAFTAIYPEHDDLVTGIWTDVAWHATSRIEVIPGARLDLYEWRVRGAAPAEAPTTSVLALDPRLALRFALLPDLAVFATLGQYHQGPSFFVPVPGLQPSGFQNGLQRAVQYSSGVAATLPADLALTGSVFAHDNRNVTSFSNCAIPSGGFDLASSCIRARHDGTTIGLEMLVKRSLTKRLGGWIAYTLSRSVDGLRSGGPRTPTLFDHTHVVNVVTSVDLGSRWTAGARLFSYTGRPISADRLQRADPFVRLDVRLEKQWPFLTSGRIAVVLEALNVTFAKEDSGDPACRTPAGCTGGAVVVPSIGVEASSM